METQNSRLLTQLHAAQSNGARTHELAGERHRDTQKEANPDRHGAGLKDRAGGSGERERERVREREKREREREKREREREKEERERRTYI